MFKENNLTSRGRSHRTIQYDMKEEEKNFTREINNEEEIYGYNSSPYSRQLQKQQQQQQQQSAQESKNKERLNSSDATKISQDAKAGAIQNKVRSNSTFLLQQQNNENQNIRRQNHYPPPPNINSTQIRSGDLSTYYKNFFPTKLLCTWLSMNQGDTVGINSGYGTALSNTEFSFRDVFNKISRYVSFDNWTVLEVFLQKQNPPAKIDIGATFVEKPRFPMKNKEVKSSILKIDIDLPNYNQFRNCCNQTNRICRLCWKFLVVAVKILDATLRDDFGFRNVLWVWSGGKGVHCWVFDRSAMLMDENMRKAVLQYLNLLTSLSEDRQVRTVGWIPDTPHPYIKIAQKYFKEIIVEDQKMLSNSQCRRIIASLYSGFKQSEVLTAMADLNRTGSDLWNFLQQKMGNGFNEAITLGCLAPRFDKLVTEQPRHLLKSPFSVHMTTGRVSMVINPDTVESFDIDNAPTLEQLVDPKSFQSSFAFLSLILSRYGSKSYV